ncbi:MAG: ParB/RepB/Spo0J family partition protein [Candidatus Dadabacteria bacterium]|nr:MAG: ParB/RepB/Spo0J family partition protein [Candidatus Dadabacteria bacterium]
MARKLVLANNPLLSGPSLKDREKSGIPYREIKISSVERDSNQPRVQFDEERLKELAESIKLYGVLSPILVRPARIPGKFELISGERRLRAARMIGLSTIPAIVDFEKRDDQKTLAVQLVENLQRADLTPLERAHAISALKDTYKLSVREVAKRLGVSKSMVQRSLELLDLPDDLLNALREGASESKILLLSKIKDRNERARYLAELDTLPRHRLEVEVKEKKPTQQTRNKKPATISAEDRRIADEMQRALGVKVRLTRSSANSEAGRVVIDFYSEEDLQEIFRKLVSA